jgi:multidrug efflux pump subunit AcrB
MLVRPYQILLFFLIISLLGILSVPRIGLRLVPLPKGSTLQVAVGWPGASPLVMEQQVTAAIEGVVSTIGDIKSVESTSGYHQATLYLSLNDGANADLVRFEVAAQLRRLYAHLPPGVTYPELSLSSARENQKQQPFMIVQVNGAGSVAELSAFAANTLTPRFALMEGLYGVQVQGRERQEWRVAYSPDYLHRLGLTKKELVAALQRQGNDEQVGWLRDRAGRQQSVSVVSGSKEAPLTQAVVGNKGGRVLYVRDISSIEQRNPRPMSYYRVNGRNAVQLVLTARPEANQLALSRQVREVLAQVQQQATFGLRVEYDASDFIRENLMRMGWQSGAAAVLLLLVLGFLLRDMRYLLLITVSLLVSLCVSMLVFYALDITMHLYTLAALTVSLGLLIDNALVMTDHYRHHRNRRVITALLGATLTTCTALTVIWFLPEAARRDLLEFGQVLILTLAVSLAVAYWFVPAWLETWPLRRADSRKVGPVIAGLDRQYGKLLSVLCRFPKVMVGLAVLLFGLPVFLLPASLPDTSPYTSGYKNLIGSAFYQEEIRPFLDKALGGTLRLFVNYVYENGYYADNERTLLYVIADLPNQSTPEQMNELMKQMEGVVAQDASSERFVTEIYSGQQAMLTIYFKKDAESGLAPYRLKARLINRSTNMSGVGWDIYGVGQGFNQRTDENQTPSFNVVLRGYNYDQLEKVANRLAEKLLPHPRIQEVDIDRAPGFFSQKNLYTYQLPLDESALAGVGARRAAVVAALRERFAARPEADFYQLTADGYEAVQVVPTEPGDVWQINHLALDLNDSTAVKLANTPPERRRMAPQIRKEDQQYIRQLSFEYYGNYTFGNEFLTKTLQEFQSELPLGYEAERISLNWWQQDAPRQYGLVGLVILAIFLIGTVQFESFKQSFWMILQIPFSFAGVFVAFYLSGYDQGGYASFLLLAGLVVNATLFLLDEFNVQLKRSPINPLLAYRRAVRGKLRPILLSILTTITGLVPFLWLGAGQPFWPALAVGTCGGLLLSIAMLLVVFPVFIPSLSKPNKSHDRRL